MKPKTNEEWITDFQNKEYIEENNKLYVEVDAVWLYTLLEQKDKEKEEAVAEALRKRDNELSLWLDQPKDEPISATSAQKEEEVSRPTN